MIERFSNGEKITNHDWELIENMVAKESLQLSLAEAIELREFDKFHADKETAEEKEEKKAIKKAKKEKKEQNTITSESNLKWIYEEIILVAFKDKEFKSKDLWKLVSDKFTNRQTPHALTKLHKEGYLELIEGKSPKTYRIKG